MTGQEHRQNAPLVRIEDLAATARFSLRLREAGREAAGGALGLGLPMRIGDVTRKSARAVVCLGPDEWLVAAPENESAAILAAFADLYERTPHSLVDLSDREVTFRVSGPGAFTLMTIGCPRDLGRLTAGRAVRTLFDSATVILWRDGEDDFRLDVWRSFAPNVRELLETGRAELATGL